MQKSISPMALLFIALLAIQSIYILALEMPLVPDVYERLRVSSEIMADGFIPAQDNSFFGGEIYFIYPPFADLLLSGSSIFSFLSPEIAWKFLAIIFFGIFISGMYFLGRKFLQQKELWVMLILCALAPVIVRRYATFVSEEYAFALVPWFLYLFFTKRHWIAGLLLAAIGLIHFRTFGMLLLVIFVWILYYLAKKNFSALKSAGKILLPVLVIALSWYLLNFSKIISLSGYENPVINEGITLPLNFIGLPILVFAILFFLLRINRKFNDEFWLFLALPVLIIAGLFVDNGIPFPYRAAIFLVIPLSMLAAISFARLFEFGKLQALSAIILIAMCFAFSYPFAPSPYTQNQSSAADFIIQNYGKGTTVLADYETSYLLAYKGAVVYVGPYMERFSDASQRMKTAQDFFSLGDNSALSIWQPECILFRQVPISPLPAGYKQVYSNPEARVFCYLG